MTAQSRPRIPLAGAALAATAGIIAASYSNADAVWLAAAALGTLPFALLRRGSAALYVATALAFGAAHVWQSRQNPWRAWADTVAAEPRVLEVTGIIDDAPQEIVPGIWRTPLRTTQWIIDGREIAAHGKVLARWKTGDAIPAYGDKWRIEGVAIKPEPPRNPGEFDAAAHWARQGIFLEVRGARDAKAQLLERGQGSPIKHAALAARAWMLGTLALGISDAPAIGALVAGITLGARAEDADQFADTFRQTGTFHLFSVSGLHVGMFGLIAWLALRPLGMTRRSSVLVIVPLLFFYALVTGASPPSLRAALMISVAFGGMLLDREGSPANSLAAAALLLLAWDTNQLFTAGFQLSFLIVAAIFLLAPALQEFFTSRLRPDPFLPRRLYNRRQKTASNAGHALGTTLGVSTAAWLGSLPLTIAIFHLVPLISVPANLCAVPLAFAILAVSMLSLAAGLASPWMAAVFNNTNWGLAHVLLAVVQGAANIPGAYVYLPPAWLQPPARLTVFDLGTGGAQLLRTRTAAWLFDTGTERDFLRVIEPNLRAAGVGRLDALVATHGDTEHIGGAIACVQAAAPQRIIDSALRDRSPARRRLHDLLARQSRPKSVALPGDCFAAGEDTLVRVLAPADTARTSDDQALVLSIRTRGFKTLLMSDAGAKTEADLLRNHGAELESDILVLGRHGEDIFATQEFLEAVRPRLIVLAQTDPFRDGSDEKALRERLEATGADVFDQSECGAVTVNFSGDRAIVRGFLDGRDWILNRE
ncbi:MAG: DUF4131 domain-containing protein [Chthoniobacterales bacterium]|nr:DUF4131 domain-containing protein [Chthoniobacterales bacterium]